MYEAPVDDYKFVIDHVIGLDQLIATTGHDDISIDLVAVSYTHLTLPTTPYV